MAELKPFTGELDAPATLQPFDGQLDGEERKPSGAIRRIADQGIKLAQGVVGVPEAAVGVADLVTGGQAGKLAESAGVRFKDAKQALGEYLSPEQKAADAEVAKADGFFPTLGAMARNPSTIVGGAVESAPSMLLGGAASRGLLAVAPKIGAIAAGAAGEGITAAGQNAEQVRQEDPNGTLTGQQSALLAGSGVLTGAISGAAGKLANRLGIGDVQTMLAQGKLGVVGEEAAQAAAKKGLARKIAEGFASEGMLQELPQSYQEQVAQNLAQGKPWDEGAGAAGAQGMLAGGLMGGGGNVLAHVAEGKKPAAPPATPPLQIGNTPDPYISFPDGTVARRSEVEAYVNSLPADQQPAARAKMMGLAPQPAAQEPAPPAGPPAQLGYNPLAGTPTIHPDGTVTLNGEQEFQRRTQAQPVRPSEAMGLDPAAGPMSAAATIAVDTGAHQQHLDQQQQQVDQAQADADQAAYDAYMAQQDAEAQQRDTIDKPITQGPLAEAAMSDEDKRAVLFSNQAVADGGQRHPGTQDGDILNGAGAPYSNYLAAARRSHMEGKDWIPVKIGDKQFVARRKDAANVSPETGVQPVPTRTGDGRVSQPTPSMASGLGTDRAARPAVDAGSVRNQPAGADVLSGRGINDTPLNTESVANVQNAPAGTQAAPATPQAQTAQAVESNAAATDNVPGAGSTDLQAAGVKAEPWQMTYGQYLDTFDAEGREWEGLRASEHRVSVSKAVKEGRMSPDSASMMGYPDIANDARRADIPGKLEKIVSAARGVSDAAIDGTQNNDIKATTTELKKLFGSAALKDKDIAKLMDRFGPLLSQYGLSMQIGPDFNPTGNVAHFASIRGKVAAVIENTYREVLTEAPTPQPTHPIAGEGAGVSPAEDKKAKWLKAINDQNRLMPVGGVQLTVQNGKLTFMGNPDSSKQGKALQATLAEAQKAGASVAEIIASIQAPAPKKTLADAIAKRKEDQPVSQPKEQANGPQAAQAQPQQTQPEAGTTTSIPEPAAVAGVEGAGEVAGTEPNLQAAKNLLAQQKAATGNAVAEGRIRKKLRDLAAITPQDHAATVMALDTAATRLGMGEGKLKGLEFAPATKPVSDTQTADAPAKPDTQRITTDKAEMRPYRKPDGSVGYEDVPIYSKESDQAIVLAAQKRDASAAKSNSMIPYSQEEIDAAQRLSADKYQDQAAAQKPPQAPANTAQPATESVAKPREAIEHAGVKIYPITFKGEPHWSVQSEDNRTNGKVLGDTIHATLEGAKQSAEEQVRRVKSKQERNAAYEAEQAAAQAKKDANKGKSLADRKRDFDLDKPTKLPVQAGLGTGTRRESMQKAVDQDRAIVERMVQDTAAKKRDNDAVDLVRARGYILGMSNENIPVVKAGLEAQARLKVNDYKKPEYRVYSGRDTEGSFHEITKTEYDYAQGLQKPSTALAEPAQVATETVAKPRKKPAGGKTLRSKAYDKNPLLTFLATHGLFHDKTKPGSHKVEFSPDKAIMVMGYGPVFKKTGKRLDELTQNAIEEGYLPTDGTESQLRELVRRAVAGEKISPLYAEGVAEQIAEQNFAEHLAQQQEAAQNEDFDDPFGPMLDGDFVADDFDVPGYDEASDPIKLEVNALLALADDAGINEDAREAIKEDAHYATLDQSEQAYYEAYRNALKAAIAASNRVGSADSGEASNAQGQREASPPEISGSVSAVQSSQKALEAGQAEIDEAKGLKYKLPYLEDRLKENLDPTDGFDMHILANELPPNRAYNKMMTDHNGDFSGVEFKNKDGRHAFVLPDASQPGKWRVSYFDKDGFSRHESEPTREKAQQSLARDGYTIEDRGALDRLASTKEWARGTDFAGLIFQLNSGAITHAQFIEKQNKLNADYEASKGEGLTLTAPSRQDVLAQQAAIDAEAKRKEEGGDKPIPRKQLTGDIPDLFNPQGSVFDVPEEPTPAAEATAILDAANVTGKERIDALKDVKKGDITPEELQAAYPAKEDGEKTEPWKMTRAEAADAFPGDEYDKMLNRHAVLGDLTYEESNKRSRINITGNKEFWAKTRKELLQDKKDAVKFARGDRAEVNKMKPTEGFAAWRIKSMSATGKAAIEAAGKYHDELLAVHKERVQEALDEGKDVPAEVLADYPDLAKPDNSVKPEAKSEISDFGEVLPGARKDAAPSLKTELSDNDIATQPLSKIWPADEYLTIEDKFASAIAFAARSEVPSKPRTAYKVKSWVERVKVARGLAQRITSGEVSRDRMAAEMAKTRSLSAFADKVALLEAIDKADWPRIDSVEVYPDAYRYNEDGTQTKTPLVRVSIDGRSRSFDGATSVADVVERVSAMLGTEVQQEKRMAFEVRGTTGKGFAINKKGDKEYRKLKSFPTAKEALDFVKTGYAELVAEWEGVKDRDNVKEDDVRGTENRPRTAKDYRNGKDVTSDEFAAAFGFRGGQFGNWVNQGEGRKDRQGMLNQAYDALMDLADIVGVPPKALSLNGSLGIAFGARGSGKASAHFEPDTLVINLTKTRGAGVLAHEWFHALDNYFSHQRGGAVPMVAGMSQLDYRKANYITYKPEPLYVHKTKQSTPITKATLERYAKTTNAAGYYNPENWHLDPRHPEGVRPEVERRIAELVEALNASPMAQRAAMNDKAPEGYWSRIIERAARSFENYVISKMMERGYHNDYLANVREVSDFPRSKERYPYLLPEEVKPIAEAFDSLFSTVKTKETDKGVALYSKSRKGANNGSEQQSLAPVLPVRADVRGQAERGWDSGGRESAENTSGMGGVFQRGAKDSRYQDSGLGNITVKTQAVVEKSIKAILAKENATAVLVSGGNSDVLRDIARKFGKQIVFFREVQDGGPQDGGVGTPAGNIATRNAGESQGVSEYDFITNGFVSPSRPDVVFLNADGVNHLMYILGHELGHTLKLDDPVLWKQMAKELQPLVRRWSEYKASLSQDFDNDTDYAEELFGDVIGENFMNPEFWSDMAQQNKTLFQKIAAAAKAMLDKAISLMVGRQSSPYITDMKKARDIIAKTMAEYAFSRGKNGAVTNQTDVVGNQGGRYADDSTPGASFDAQAAFEKHGGDGDIDESTDIRAKSLAFADMAEATGYEVAGRGDKYVTITKSFGENADGYDKKAVINVRISDHSNVNRGHHFGDTDINIAPDDGYSRDTFEDALRKIKSAYVNDDLDTIIPNESTAPDSGGVKYSRSIGNTLTSAANSARDVNLPAGYKVGDLFNSVPGKLNWWHKTVGTQYNLAQRSKPFKRVYDAVQKFMDDVSYFATEAADLAPNILPKLESWKDMAKSPLSAEDTKALGTPVFEGTLIWARDESGKPVKMDVLETAAAKLTAEQKAQRLLRGDHLSEQVLKMWQGLPIDQYEAMIEGKYERDMLKAGIVFTDAELKSLFGLTDKQIPLYREFRKTVDKSLTNLAVADMLRFGGKDVDPIRAQVLDSKTVGEAAETLRDYLLSLTDLHPGRAESLTDTANKMIDKGDKAQDLMDRGYAPLSRFGTYTLDVVDSKGERVYFGLFESAADASRMRRKMEGLHPGATVNQGTLSEQAYKLFAGVSPETLELFGDMLGLEAQGDKESAKAFQEYLKLAKSNRSAMKRLIQRKGIAGFSEDAGRVLAGFVYSNARQTASSLNMGEMTNAAADKEAFGNQGELQDAAVKLVDYIKNPQEEAQALRGLMFAQYIGGSVASAMVNMTQPITMTFPWLAQYGGAGKAAKQMTAAMKDSGKKTTGDTKLDAALHRAEEDGTVSPQEVHQLMKQAQGQGALRSGDGTRAGNALATAHNAMSRVGLAWGKLFSVAEQFNRRVTFIAAYRTAVEQGIPDPDGFARRAIHETQGVYNKGNKPAWARGAVGSTLFTFKQYSIAYVEMLSRMAKNGPEGKKAALLALGVLFLLSGAGGMPGADDLDDVISGAMQALGYNFDSKMKRKEFFVSLLGEGGAQFMERGVSGLPGVPIDVSGRMGLGNLVPGTGLFTKKTDHTRDIAEIAGPVGDFAKRGFDAAGKLITGDVSGAANSMVPKAIQNLTQAYDMANMGMYRDQTGKKVIDTDGYDAISKAIGFQPNDVKRVQDANQEAVRMIGLNKINETKIADQWAQGVFEKNPEKIQSARDDLAEWNRDNPESPIRINFRQIASRVHQMNMTKAERVAKTAPKEIRATVRKELESVR